MEDSYYGYRLFIIALVLGLNGFFAAAEVALISVRKSKLRSLAGEGNAGAQIALNLLSNPGRLLSVTQVGVTLASLGLGWAGEGTLFSIIISILQPAITPAWTSVIHGLSFGVAFLGMSYAHVVLGEVLPKNLALEKADRLAVLVAPALLVFYKISSPFVIVVERSSAAICRWMGLKGESHGGGHSVEELKFVVSSSRSAGHLEDFEELAISRLLELKDHSARQIMVPRSQIVSVAVNGTLDHVLRLMDENQFSRLPVYEGSPERIIGIIHFKDLVRVWMERRAANEARKQVAPFRLRRHLRKALVVPETKALNELIEEFLASHTHMALVVDEFGTISGLVTLEDSLEQVFGEIEDEHDVRRALPGKGAQMLEFEGTINIRDLETQYGVELPISAGFETLAGFLLFRLGYIPRAGEAVTYGHRKFTILEMDKNRIAKIKIERMTEPEAEAKKSETW